VTTKRRGTMLAPEHRAATCRGTASNGFWKHGLQVKGGASGCSYSEWIMRLHIGLLGSNHTVTVAPPPPTTPTYLT
jgi:hypothetical protein